MMQNDAQGNSGDSVYKKIYQQQQSIYSREQHPSPHMNHSQPLPPSPHYSNPNPTSSHTSSHGVYPAPIYLPPNTPSLGNPFQAENNKDYFRGFHDGIVQQSGPVWGNAISWIAPLVVNIGIFVLPIWYVRRRYLQTMSSVGTKFSADGKGKANNPFGSFMDMMNPMKPKNFRTDVKGTKFEDIIGIPEAKEDLKQYVDFLKDPKKFTRLGARLPKGCLLTGSPGTGKTLLARAVAGEASTPFFSCSGADFIEIFGGSGPKRVRELFQEAKAAAPCVVFIDEIDAIGSRNQGGRGMGGGASEENRTINQLLAELDGLTSEEAIVVVAATNFPEAIDKALLREGRFDRKVNIPMPDRKARTELFDFYLNQIMTGDKNCKLKIQTFSKPKQDGDAKEEKDNTDKEVKAEPPKIEIKVIKGVSNKAYAEALADRTPGVTPAQIATIVNEAALTAAVREKEVVPLDILQESIDDVLIGKKRQQRMSDKSLRRTSYHEVGHCIMAWLSPLQKDVVKLSIIPRGRAGGYTQQIQDEALEPHTDAFLFSQLCVLMGGRVAERIFMKDISTGAMDDLQRATKIAMEKLLMYGMSKSIGQLAFKNNDKNDGRAWMTWSEDLHAKVEAEARELVASAYRFTEKTLLENKAKHEQLTELLLEKRELGKDDILKVLGPRPVKKEELK